MCMEPNFAQHNVQVYRTKSSVGSAKTISTNLRARRSGYTWTFDVISLTPGFGGGPVWIVSPQCPYVPISTK